MNIQGRSAEKTLCSRPVCMESIQLQQYSSLLGGVVFSPQPHTKQDMDRCACLRTDTRTSTKRENYVSSWAYSAGRQGKRVDRQTTTFMIKT